MIINHNADKHNWKFYHSSSEAWKGFYQDCKQAKKLIDFEQYIIRNDKIGKSFLKLFIQKAKEGIKIRVICDWIGSITLTYSKLIKELRSHGGEVYFFNPITRWKLTNISTWFKRDHRKLIIIDSKIVYVGGICIDRRMFTCRDSVIRLTGDIALELQKQFDYMWQEVKSRKPKSKCLTSSQNYDNFYCLINQAAVNKKELSNALLERINKAKKYIYLTTGYFVPNRKFFVALKKAANRNVKVVLLVPEDSNIKIVNYTAIYYYQEALRSNIRIFTYYNSLLHAKCAVIDDNWATIGSMNLDYLSLIRNYELNIAINNKKAIEALKRQFLEDLKYSQELKINNFKRGSIFENLIGIIGFAFRKYI